jgi:NTP pyrophosphatase (non-canonical NTP hydrolase)
VDADRYQDLALRTRGEAFHAERVHPCHLDRVLTFAISVSSLASEIKAALFYGRESRSRLHIASGWSAPSASYANLSPDVIHAALGLIDEVGELARALKTALAGGELDRINLLEEAGDAEWYLSLLVHSQNASLGATLEANIAKLRRRVGERFTDLAANSRDLASERAVLEAHLVGREADDAAEIESARLSRD